MDSFEIRKNGDLIETIHAHEFLMRGKNAIFSLYGQVQTVIALEPGMRVDRVCEAPRPSIDDIVNEFFEQGGAGQTDKGHDDPPPKVIQFPK